MKVGTRDSVGWHWRKGKGGRGKARQDQSKESKTKLKSELDHCRKICHKDREVCCVLLRWSKRSKQVPTFMLYEGTHNPWMVQKDITLGMVLVGKTRADRMLDQLQRRHINILLGSDNLSIPSS